MGTKERVDRFDTILVPNHIHLGTKSQIIQKYMLTKFINIPNNFYYILILHRLSIRGAIQQKYLLWDLWIYGKVYGIYNNVRRETGVIDVMQENVMETLNQI